MSDSGADAVRGLLADIERAESTFERVSGRIAEETGASVREAQRERDALREGEQEARTRAERAERAAQVLRDEREVIRKALRAVTGRGDSGAESST